MKSIVNESLLPNGEGLRLADKPKPAPGRGELLVRVNVAGINPADQLLTEGRYYIRRAAPFVPGLLAVGEVVEHNAGLMGRLLMGRKVFFSSGYERDGAWSEYALADAATALPIGDLDEDAAVNLGNAITAVGLIATAKEAGARAVVVNAAAGNLGGLIWARAKRAGLGFIGIVRGEAQVALLKQRGVQHVLDQNRDGFADDLARLAAELQASVFIDSLGGGDLLVRMLEAMPVSSTVLIIGHLSGAPMSFDSLPLLMGRKLTLRAFGINQWLATKSLPSMLLISRRAQALLAAGEGSRVARRVSLDEVVEAFGELTKNTSAGKTLVYPNGVPARSSGAA